MFPSIRRLHTYWLFFLSDQCFYVSRWISGIENESYGQQEGVIVAKLLMLCHDFVNVECRHSKLEFCCEFFYNADLNRIRKAC